MRTLRLKHKNEDNNNEKGGGIKCKPMDIHIDTTNSK
jgi:hypothetical protein